MDGRTDRQIDCSLVNGNIWIAHELIHAIKFAPLSPHIFLHKVEPALLKEFCLQWVLLGHWLPETELELTLFNYSCITASQHHMWASYHLFLIPLSTSRLGLIFPTMLSSGCPTCYHKVEMLPDTWMKKILTPGSWPVIQKKQGTHQRNNHCFHSFSPRNLNLQLIKKFLMIMYYWIKFAV